MSIARRWGGFLVITLTYVGRDRALAVVAHIEKAGYQARLVVRAAAGRIDFLIPTDAPIDLVTEAEAIALAPATV